MSEHLQEKLSAAYASVQAGDAAGAADTVAELKALPRTPDGIFDLTSAGGDIWETARLAYPVYAAYETACNKKEGYPDIIAQMRAWNRRLNEEMTFSHVARACNLWIHTVLVMSPEIYEYYRELLDIFRDQMRGALAKYYGAGPAAQEPKTAEDEDLFLGALRLACDNDLMLAEKYSKYFRI